ncbi:hypothetical protein PGH12_16505 [Chryseobacterium wangxinyae]|uniref:hypothetical protein n=1 Tax=Chryseobacterium sp. CY350 TaxID=2997336 RepID=UPI002271E05F|nr:hypothetical protein [Chryseobacterium sp. CY350]MCY0977960.1 hypothetical protein [Chryseobacterium sp. CY350]WBZ95047.1 hypothetical protein PGH12_16505 [Chryseobacterium sp. CY350]
MKKTLFAGLLLATMGTATLNANTISNNQPETTQTCIVVTYIKVTENKCTVTYKVSTPYFLCIPLTCLATKCEISRVCDGGGGTENR